MFFLFRKAFSLLGKFRYYYYLFFNRLHFLICGAELGSNFKVYNKFYLSVKGKLFIGDNFLFTSGDFYNPLCRNIRGCICVNNGARLIIGNNVGISSACIWVHHSIVIGNNVKIGGDCILLDSDAHSLCYIERRDVETDQANKKSKKIIIEDDVLIGARCIILKGVVIGTRSIIGAGSVVVQSIPADCIAAGNPCKVIKYLKEK